MASRRLRAVIFGYLRYGVSRRYDDQDGLAFTDDYHTGTLSTSSNARHHRAYSGRIGARLRAELRAIERRHFNLHFRDGSFEK